MLQYYGITKLVSTVTERTYYMCYNDLISIDNDLLTLNNALSFLYNSTNYYWQNHSTIRPGGPNQYNGPHSSTSSNNTTNSTTTSNNNKNNLLQYIYELDDELFHNELSWLYSILPCQTTKTKHT